MTQVLMPTAYGGSGNTYSDEIGGPGTLRDNGHKTQLLPLIADMVAMAAHGATKAGTATAAADAAEIARAAAVVARLAAESAAATVNPTNFQPKDATLTALAALTTAANKLIYATGSDAFALADFTAAARTFCAAADAAAQRSAIGVVSASVSAPGIVQLNNSLSSIATDQALTAAQGKVLNDSKVGKNAQGQVVISSENEYQALKILGSDYLSSSLQQERSGVAVWTWLISTDGSYLIRCGDVTMANDFFRVTAAGEIEAQPGGAGGWKKVLNGSNFIHAQNTSGSAVSINGTVAGSGLTPAQTGTWRNVSGVSIANSGYGLWQKV